MKIPLCGSDIQGTRKFSLPILLAGSLFASSLTLQAQVNDIGEKPYLGWSTFFQPARLFLFVLRRAMTSSNSVIRSAIHQTLTVSSSVETETALSPFRSRMRPKWPLSAVLSLEVSAITPQGLRKPATSEEQEMPSRSRMSMFRLTEFTSSKSMLRPVARVPSSSQLTTEPRKNWI